MLVRGGDDPLRDLPRNGVVMPRVQRSALRGRWRRTCVAVLTVITLIASSCSNGDDDDSDDDDAPTTSPAVETTSSTEVAQGITDLEPCPPLTSVNCPVRASTVTIPLTGTGLALVYRSDRVPGRTVAPRFDARPFGWGGWTLDAEHHYERSAGALIGGDGTTRVVEPIEADGDLLVATADGSELHEFDGDGRLTSTFDGLTGRAVSRFSYDDDGYLAAIERGDGQRTTITRQGGTVVVTGPDGAAVTLQVSDNGFLDTISDASARTFIFSYSVGGLLTSAFDTAGRTVRFTYDDDGRLTSATDPVGRTTTYAGTDSGDDVAVTATDAAGFISTWSVAMNADGTRHASVERPGGVRLDERIDADGTRVVVAPDGTQVEVSYGPDARFGTQAPVPLTITTTTPQGRTFSERNAITADLEGDDPRVVRSYEQEHSIGDATSTLAWDAASGQLTSIDASGSVTTATFDAGGALTAVARPDGTTLGIDRDDSGRVARIDDAGRVTTFDLDASSGEVIATGPLGAVTRTAADVAGRPAAVVRPDGSRLSVEVDPSGRPVAFRVDGEQAHTLGWSTSGELVAHGLGSSLALETVDLDAVGRPVVQHRGDGRTVGYTYGDDGLVATIALGAGDVEVRRDPATGRVEEYADPSGLVVSTSFDGPLVTGSSVSGPFEAGLTWSVDDAGSMDGVVVHTATGDEAIDFDHDLAGRLLRAGELRFGYDEQTGELVGSTAGALTSEREYDPSGAVAAERFTAGGVVVYSIAYERDGAGRITATTESVAGGAPVRTGYGHDALGRVTSVTVDGVRAYAYEYDASDRPVSVTTPDGTEALEYDAAGNVVARGDTRFRWGLDNALVERTAPAGTTTFSHDELGRLTGAVLADGTEIAYQLDLTGALVARHVDGALDRGWLRDAGGRPVAEVDGTGEVVRTFVHGPDGALALVADETGTYRVVTDADGNPRVLIDVRTGDVVDRVERDPFGRLSRALDDVLGRSAQQGLGRAPTLDWAGPAGDDAAGIAFPAGGMAYDPVAGQAVVRSGPIVPFFIPAPGGGGGRQPTPVDGGELDGPRVFDLDGWVPTFPADPPRSIEPPAAPQPADPLAPTWDALGDAVLEQGGYSSGAFGFQGGKVAFSGLSLLKGLGDLGDDLRNLFTHDASGTSKAKAVYDLASILGNTAQFIAGGIEWAAAAGLIGEGSVLLVALPIAEVLTFIAAAAAAAYLAFLLASILSGHSAGDPHLRTFDGLSYDFQAVGEFMLVRSDAGDLEVQARHGPKGSLGLVSLTTAVAVDLAGDRITITADASLPLRVDGRAVDLPAGTVELAHGGSVGRLPTGQYAIVHPDGETTILVTVLGHNRLDVQLFLAGSRAGSVHGLYGDADGDMTNDLASRDGQVVEPTGGDFTAPLYATFGDSWRVDVEESLFDYGAGEDTATFTIHDYPLALASVDAVDAGARAQAEAVCRGALVTQQPFLDDCILDVGLLGDPAFATSAVTAQASTLATGREDGTSTRFEVGAGDAVAPDRPAPGAGRIEEVGERDIYDVVGTAGTFMYARAAEPCPSDDLVWTVQGQPGSGVNESQPICVDVGRFELDGGPVTITVSGTGNATGTYGFSLEAGDDPATDTIAPGDTVEGEVSTAGEEVRYELRGRRGDVMYLRAADPCEIDLRWVVFGPPGSAVNRTETLCGDLGRVELDVDGTYTVTVQGADRGTGPFTYEVLAASAPQVFSIALGDAIAPDEPAAGAGRIERPGDIDRYEVRGSAGGTLTITPSTGCDAPTLLIVLTGPPGSAVNTGSQPCSPTGPIPLDVDGSYTITVSGINDGTDDYALRVTG
jgi:YD repeat-containing protein